MTDPVKYPRTMHLPWSPGLQNDDRVMTDLSMLEGQEVVVTEKMDGENTSMYRDYIHARSVDGRHHPSRDWIKRFYAENMVLRLSPGARICGENMYARHSIAYDDLETYFYGFSYWDGDTCLPWEETLLLFEYFGITPVRELYRGPFDVDVLHDIEKNIDPEQQEGYVVRLSRLPIKMEDFSKAVGKWVRKGHVQTNDHWMHSEIIPNKLGD